jgi:hypothetical protein
MSGSIIPEREPFLLKGAVKAAGLFGALFLVRDAST